jgi:hypothetical protein
MLTVKIKGSNGCTLLLGDVQEICTPGYCLIMQGKKECDVVERIRNSVKFTEEERFLQQFEENRPVDRIKFIDWLDPLEKGDGSRTEYKFLACYRNGIIDVIRFQGTAYITNENGVTVQKY